MNAKLGDTIVIYIASLRRGTFTINPNHLVDFQYAWRQLRIITDFEDSIERHDVASLEWGFQYAEGELRIIMVLEDSIVRRNVTPEWGNDRKKYFHNKLQLPFNSRRESNISQATNAVDGNRKTQKWEKNIARRYPRSNLLL